MVLLCLRWHYTRVDILAVEAAEARRGPGRSGTRRAVAQTDAVVVALLSGRTYGTLTVPRQTSFTVSVAFGSGRIMLDSHASAPESART